MRSPLVFVIAGACLASVLAATSLAAGGTSVANAPVVASGKQNFGNTANMPRDRNGYHNEYWRLQLVSGDAVTINHGVASAQARYLLCWWPVGVTDFNIYNTSSSGCDEPDANGKSQLTFSAPRTGVYPLRFQSYGSGSGPFEFVTYIRHGMRLFIPATSSVSRTGSVSVQVRNPDGAPVTDKGLRVTLRGIWGKKAHTLGKTTAANGLAKFKLNLPASLKGQTIRIRAIGQGSNYIGALSVTRAVRVR